MCGTDQAYLISMDDGDIVTSVIMTRQTFNEVWKILESIEFIDEHGKEFGPKELAEIRAEGRIPMLKRSKSTETIFERFKVMTTEVTGALRQDGPWIPEGEHA